jgi:type VI secretion system protein
MSTLLGRLGNPQAALTAGASDAELRSSILDNLQRMCRTRRGSMRARPDYGLPDLSEMVHSFPDAVGQIRSALQHTIEAYEPRLTNVRVSHVPSETLDLVVRFEITATLVDPTRKVPLRFETQLSASRAVDVV